MEFVPFMIIPCLRSNELTLRYFRREGAYQWIVMSDEGVLLMTLTMIVSP